AEAQQPAAPAAAAWAPAQLRTPPAALPSAPSLGAWDPHARQHVRGRLSALEDEVRQLASQLGIGSAEQTPPPQRPLGISPELPPASPQRPAPGSAGLMGGAAAGQALSLPAPRRVAPLGSSPADGAALQARRLQPEPLAGERGFAGGCLAAPAPDRCLTPTALGPAAPPCDLGARPLPSR
ncbi:unnamed protein product, partial [Prorocentrum cordatum]